MDNLKLGAVVIAAAFLLSFFVAGCTAVERQAYNAIVGAKAFLDTAKKAHPECAVAGTTSTVCSDITKAIAAKDALIDAVEVYCAGPQFTTGGACNAPAKGTPAATQATAKLQAAIASYNQFAADLKGVL
jgi:hypothetical protein